MSTTRLEEALTRIGPVMAQLFGQTEAPMMVSALPPADHFLADGSIAHERLASAGRPTPLVTVAIMGDDGALLDVGERGEIVVRSSLVMRGYYRNPEATAEASAHGWHHTGDIGYLDADGFLFIVDRAKDMVITGGFNVYSTEVEQALMQHPDVADCAVVGLPDDKWGERVTAVVQLRPGHEAAGPELAAFVKAAHRQRQGAQAGRGVGRPAALQGRQGAEDRHQGAAARRLTSWLRLRRCAGSPPRPGRPARRARASSMSAAARASSEREVSSVITVSTCSRAPELVDQRAQLLHPLVVERGAERGVEQLGLGGRQRVQRQGDQHGALALDEVVARRLAGRRRVAEDAEQVVAQLEGLAQRQAEAGELVDHLGEAPRQGGADVQGPLDGVLRRLVAQHRHRRVHVGRPPRLRRDVEELPGDHLAAGQVEVAEGVQHPLGRQPAGAQQLVGPAEQQVAEQDRGRRRRSVSATPGQPRSRCSCSKARCVAGRPRRTSEASM